LIFEFFFIAKYGLQVIQNKTLVENILQNILQKYLVMCSLKPMIKTFIWEDFDTQYANSNGKVHLWFAKKYLSLIDAYRNCSNAAMLWNAMTKAMMRSSTSTQADEETGGDSQFTCLACEERDRDVCLPCGHAVLCENCCAK
jgi:CTP synthase (UTP-ammonia lyase)